MDFIQICSVLGAGIAIGMGAIGSAIGEGIVAMQAVESLEDNQKHQQKY